MSGDPSSSGVVPPSPDGGQISGHMIFLLVAIPLLAGLVIVALTLGPLLLDHWRQQALLANGQQADAQILSLNDTGTLINYQPLVAITIQVMPADRPPYQAVVKRTISVISAAYFAVGNIVPVKYDPAHPNRVAFTMGPGRTGTVAPPNAGNSFSTSVTTSTSVTSSSSSSTSLPQESP